MDLLTPDLGTYIWSLFIFMTVLFVLKRFAWNPLLDFLEEREKGYCRFSENGRKCKV